MINNSGVINSSSVCGGYSNVSSSNFNKDREKEMGISSIVLSSRNKSMDLGYAGNSFVSSPKKLRGCTDINYNLSNIKNNANNSLAKSI